MLTQSKTPENLYHGLYQSAQLLSGGKKLALLWRHPYTRRYTTLINQGWGEWILETCRQKLSLIGRLGQELTYEVFDMSQDENPGFFPFGPPEEPSGALVWGVTRDFPLVAALEFWKMAEAAIDLAQELEWTRKQQEEYISLLEVGREVSSTLEVKPLLSQIMKVATRFLRCETATVYLLDSATQELYFYLVLGNSQIGSKLSEIRLPLGTGLAGTCAKENIPIIVDEASQDSRFFSRADKISGFHTKSVLCVPLRQKDSVIGVIQVINRIDEIPFNLHDQEVLELIASQAASCIENAQLYENLQTEITHRKEMETALATKSRELAAARDQALVLAKTKADFLSNMSHEIRTPMNAIIGMTSLLSRTAMNTEQLDCVKTIRASSDALLQIINDILDFSKIEAGKIDLEVIDFDVRNTIEETLDIVSEMAGEKNLDLALFVRPGLPGRVAGDPGRIRQVLLNLLSNAIKFTEKGEIVVKVNSLQRKEHSSLVVFEVIDTGVGISPEQISKLFIPFSQADPSTTRHYGGTGLGLSISRRLIDMMGGEIGVDSQPGKGSTFWFSVPLPCTQEATPPPSHAANLLGKRALGLVSNTLSQTIISNFLEEVGISLSLADNRENLLSILRRTDLQNSRPDFVLIDQQATRTESYSLARSIRLIPGHIHTPLILMLSFSQRGDASRARQAGFSAFLTKPLKQSLFHKCLGEILPSVDHPKPEAFVTRHSVSERLGAEKLHLLVAEDHLVNQKVVTLLLEELGYRVDIVENGIEAIAAFSQKQYSGILMDCQMPEMDGYQATRKIRELEGDCGSPIVIIALTAHALVGEREKCLSAGMNDFIPKPVDLEKLGTVLGKWFPGEALTDRFSLLPDPSVKDSDPALPIMADLEGVIKRFASLGRHMNNRALQELWDIFVDSAPKSLSNLKQAFENDNMELLKSHSHALKGASRNIGANELAELCREIENWVPTKDKQRILRFLTTLEGKLSHLIQAYPQHMQGEKIP
jgi:signal transduction histidine kinase/CheY-like chemotaxis protein